VQLRQLGDVGCDPPRLIAGEQVRRRASARLAVYFTLPKIQEAKDAVTAIAAIADAVATGELTPSEAAELSKVVESYARALQSEEFEARLSKLEKTVEGSPGRLSRG
jgi:hypothetical protein